MLIDAGVTMEEALMYFGGGEPVDGRVFSEGTLRSRAARSIDYVVGTNFPKIDGCGI